VNPKKQIDLFTIKRSVETGLVQQVDRSRLSRDISLFVSAVAQLTGVHNFHTDADVRVYLPVDKLYVFDLHGKMIQAPAYIRTLQNSQKVANNG
jgi:hypothetical protein